jgi:hypothetical protein
MQMAVVQEYRDERCNVLGLALADVPSSHFDEVHDYMQTNLQKSRVAYLGALPTSPRATSKLHRCDTSVHIRILF